MIPTTNVYLTSHDKTIIAMLSKQRSDLPTTLPGGYMFNFKHTHDGFVMLETNGVSYCFDFQTGRSKVCKQGEWFQRSKMF